MTIATSVSPDKQVTTVLFRNLAASVEPLKGGPLVDERTLTVILPLEVQKSDVLLTFDIRGYAELHNCSGTLLLKPSGPSAKMIEFDKQSQAIGAVDAKSSPSDPGAAAREKAKPVRDTSNEGRDFFDRTITVLKKGATAKVTFVLMVDREFANSSAGGFIEIDSLDVSISDVPLTTNAPAPPAEAPKPASGD